MSNQSERLRGKVAIVTGAGASIGRAIAVRYALEGAKVVAVDIEDDTAAETAEAIRTAGGEALGLNAHVGRGEDVERIFSETLSAFGGIDVVVNNAALTRGIFKHVLEIDQPWWDRILETNLTGTFLCSLRAAKEMAPQGKGVIINVSSVGATRAHRGLVPYDACKGGIEAMTRALAIELAPYGVRVVGLIPGTVFPNLEDVPQNAIELASQTVPLQRPGLPDDLAGPAVFLASDDAAYVTGCFVPADGGVLAQQRPPLAEIFRVEDFPRVGPPTGD